MISKVSFQGVMPVEFYARNPKTNKYLPVVKPENVQKCQSFVIRNLNGTVTPRTNLDFVTEYMKIDQDYARCPVARTFCDKEAPVVTSLQQEIPKYVYLITGSDVEYVDEMGRKLSKAKSDIFEKTGRTQGPEIKQAQRTYYDRVKNFVFKKCARVKDGYGDKTVMRVFFEPRYGQKGDLKNFDYKTVSFFGEKEYQEMFN